MMINTPKKAFNAGRDWHKNGQPSSLHPTMKDELVTHYRRGWYMQSKISQMIVQRDDVDLSDVQNEEAPLHNQKLKVGISIPNRKAINALCSEYQLSIHDVVNYALELLQPLASDVNNEGIPK